MNKEELLKDLAVLVTQQKNIQGAINYITNKLRIIDEKNKKEEEKNDDRK